MTRARAGASVGGAFNPASFPGDGILAQSGQVDVWIDSTHAIVTPANQIHLRYRETGSPTWQDVPLTWQSMLSSGEQHYQSSTVTGTIFTAGTEYDIAFRRVLSATDVPFTDGTARLDATALVEVF